MTSKPQPGSLAWDDEHNITPTLVPPRVDLQERFDQALENAIDNFWGEFAAHYPEITTGDVTSHQNAAFRDACRRAAAEWIVNNG